MSQITSLRKTSGPGSGTVTSISAGTGITLTPNPITTTGTVALTIPAVIANGGTNATSFTNTDGVVYFDGTRLVDTTVGTAGQVLTSNGVGMAPTFQAGSGGSGIVTIDGDSGSITGTTVTIKSGLSALTCGESVKFVNSGTTSTLNVTDANLNTLIGQLAGKTSTGSGANTGLGWSALTANASSNDNTAIGYGACASLASGAGQNTAVGNGALFALLTGANNAVLGISAASNYVGAESNNVIINSLGVASESNVGRIGQATGTSTQQLNKMFICGIRGITGATSDQVLSVNSSNQITAIAAGTSGYVLTAQGAGTTPIWAAASGGVTGPVSSTNNAIATWNGTGGTALLSPPSPLVSSAGIMTNPAQPAFNANLTNNASNVTGNGATYTISSWGTVYFDQASNFNASTGVFTAPATGKYQFNFIILISSTTIASALNATLNYNSGSVMYTAQSARTASNANLSANGNFIIAMNSGDTVVLQATAYGESANTDEVYGPQTYFSGFLVC